MGDDSKPSTSKQVMEGPDYVEDDVNLYIDDEEKEIEQLGLSQKDIERNKRATEIGRQSPSEDERIPKIRFHCENCKMDEMAHYYGKEPSFANGIQFLENTYVMRDPFQPPPPRNKTKPEYFLALGANCVKCLRVVCKDPGCSIFYTRTYCLKCALEMEKEFPKEVNAKVNKQLTAKK